MPDDRIKDALDVVIKTLQPLDPADQLRILQSVAIFFGLDEPQYKLKVL